MMYRLLWAMVAVFVVLMVAFTAWVVVHVRETNARESRCHAVGGYWLDARDAAVCLDPKAVLHP